MYLGLITILVGVAILLGSYSPLIIIPLLIWILHTQFILQEEKWMESWFGESYLEYKKNSEVVIREVAVIIPPAFRNTVHLLIIKFNYL
jgi:protein-S-isoprenylcysteine O-methyltransferase Ste14